MELYERISAARNAANLTQDQLAEMMGVPCATVFEWEAGSTIPTEEQLQRLDEILGPSVEQPQNDLESETARKPKKKFPLKAVLIGVSCALVLLAAALAFMLWPRNTPFSERSEDIALASESVVRVLSYNQFGDVIAVGSAFCAFDNKTFVTNYHLISDAWKIEIITDNDVTIQIPYIRNYSEKYNVAILQAETGTTLTPLVPDASSNAKQGNLVTAISTPIGQKNTVSQGKISGTLTKDALEYLQLTATVSKGSSGGALFNEDGKVIGVISAAYDDLNLAIPIAHAVEVFEKGTYIKKTLDDTCPYEEFVSVPLSMLAQFPTLFEGYGVRIDAYISSVDSMGYAFVANEENVNKVYTKDARTWNSGSSEETELFYIMGGVYIEPGDTSHWGRDLYSPEIEGKAGNPITLVGIVNINYDYGYPRVYIDCYSYYVYK